MLKTILVALGLAFGAAIVLPSIAEAQCGTGSRASSAECSYKRQSESAARAYNTNRR